MGKQYTKIRSPCATLDSQGLAGLQLLAYFKIARAVVTHPKFSKLNEVS